MTEDAQKYLVKDTSGRGFTDHWLLKDFKEDDRFEEEEIEEIEEMEIGDSKMAECEPIRITRIS